MMKHKHSQAKRKALIELYQEQEKEIFRDRPHLSPKTLSIAKRYPSVHYSG
jgi:hypothetical protein